ncbi:hypothetical protein Syun_018914 [Stephania yunnanensis]|uniref:Chromo domain-containing protein n=1 Tax=Stephania yunnanensis TaxID=152371 RepID=A0AAP0NVF9_9MAGN
MTPFRVVYGRDPPPIIQFGAYTTAIADLEDQLRLRNTVLDELKFHLTRAQSKMKLAANGNYRDTKFQVGDRVYLKLRPYCQQSLARRMNEKMSPRFFCPFSVIDKLRKAVGAANRVQPLPTTLSADSEWVVEPAAVLGVRRTGATREVLVKWKDLPMFEAMWEPIEMIKTQFPSFPLEDNVGSRGVGIDRPPIYLKYSRKHGKAGVTRGATTVGAEQQESCEE